MLRQLSILFYSIVIMLYSHYAVSMPAVNTPKSQGLFGDLVPTAEATAGDEEEDEPFFLTKRHKYGWWWGEYRGKDDKKDRKKKLEEKPVFIPPPLSAYSYQELWNMHPENFQRLFNAYLSKAVMSLAPEDVKDYYIMQDIARRRAAAFANVVGYVIQTNPELSVLKDSPITTGGRQQEIALQLQDIKNVLSENNNEFGLVYFYSEYCNYCTVLSNVIRMFLDEYHWPIIRIDVDRNPEIAERFGVSSVPMVFIVQRSTGQHMPLIAGTVSLDAMTQYAYRSVMLMTGRITPEQYSIYEFQRNSSLDPRSGQSILLHSKQ